MLPGERGRVGDAGAGDRHATAAAFVLVLLSLPFWLVEFPPIHDLPQHLAQARLYTELGGAESDVYTTQWFRPQLLIYALLLPLWWVLPPLAAGKTFTFLLLAATAGAVFHLAHRRDRPVEGALAACLLLLNGVFYAGFFAFQLGGALFLFWLATSDRPLDGRGWLLAAVQLFLLGWAHVLWLGVAGLVWGTRVLLEERNRSGLVRLSAFLPAAVWVVPSMLGTMGQRTEAELPMGTLYQPISYRLGPQAWVDAPLGGLMGWIEPAVLLFLVAWVAVALLRPEPRDGRDLLLLGTAALLGVLWLLVPDSVVMTLQASRRWMPYALVLLLLGLPRPALAGPALRTGLVVVFLALVMQTASAWRFYDRAELGGLREGLATIEQGDRLLGLSFVEPQAMKGGIFSETYAWAEVLKGAELATSFTEFGAGLVLRTTPRERPWTRFLDFFPWTVRYTDFQYFDLVLISGAQDVHAQFEATPQLEPVTDGLPWRLYRVVGGGP